MTAVVAEPVAMRVCVVDGCDRFDFKGRQLCTMHYQRAKRAGTIETFPLAGVDSFENPMVCDCAEPDADPSRDFGMCQSCKRKPLALMGVS